MPCWGSAMTRSAFTSIRPRNWPSARATARFAGPSKRSPAGGPGFRCRSSSKRPGRGFRRGRSTRFRPPAFAGSTSAAAAARAGPRSKPNGPMPSPSDTGSGTGACRPPPRSSGLADAVWGRSPRAACGRRSTASGRWRSAPTSSASRGRCWWRSTRAASMARCAPSAISSRVAAGPALVRRRRSRRPAGPAPRPRADA